MKVRTTPLLVHVLGAGVASALLAYWALHLLEPASPIAPAPAAPPVSREPDAALAARLFGDISGGPAAAALNVQVSGVFAAGRDSSAVISVEGKPARAVLLGRDLVPGLRLAEVHADGVTLDRDGVRTRYPVPLPAIAKAAAPLALFRREGDTLTAPMQEAAPGPRMSSPSRPGSAGAPGGVLRRAQDDAQAAPHAPATPPAVPPGVFPLPGALPGNPAATGAPSGGP